MTTLSFWMDVFLFIQDCCGSTLICWHSDDVLILAQVHKGSALVEGNVGRLERSKGHKVSTRILRMETMEAIEIKSKSSMNPDGLSSPFGLEADVGLDLTSHSTLCYTSVPPHYASCPGASRASAPVG